jgi:hypothetical protein
MSKDNDRGINDRRRPMAIASMIDALVESAIVNVNGEPSVYGGAVVASASQRFHSEPAEILIG